MLREVLEGALAPEIAAAALFSAYERLQQDPASASDWVRFATSELKEELVQRVGSEEAEDLVTRIHGILGKPESAPPPTVSRSDFPTGKFIVASGPCRALVVARGGHLARLLRVSLGPRIVPLVLNDLDRTHDFIMDFVPTLIVLDQTDPIQASPGAVAKSLKSIPTEVLRVIWCDDPQDTGELAALLEKAGQTTVLSRSHGVEPLLDMVRASQTV